MKLRILTSKTFSYVTIFIFLAIMIIGLLIFYKHKETECINNGGIVVTNSGGLFDKCIYK